MTSAGRTLGDEIRNRGDGRTGHDAPEAPRASLRRNWLRSHLARIYTEGQFNEAILRPTLETTRRTKDGTLGVIVPGQEKPVLDRTLRVPQIGDVLQLLSTLEGDEVLLRLEKRRGDRGLERSLQFMSPADESTTYRFPIPLGSRPEELGDREIRRIRDSQDEAVSVPPEAVRTLRDKLEGTVDWLADNYPGVELPVSFDVATGTVTVDATYTEERIVKSPQDLPGGLQEDPPDESSGIPSDRAQSYQEAYEQGEREAFGRGAASTPAENPPGRRSRTVHRGGSRTFEWPHYQDLDVERIGVEIQLLVEVLHALPPDLDGPVHFGLTTDSRPRLTMGYQGYIWAMKADTATMAESS